MDVQERERKWGLCWGHWKRWVDTENQRFWAARERNKQLSNFEISRLRKMEG